MAKDPPSAPEPPHSIMDFLKQVVGRQARVALRQVDSVPVVKPVEGQGQSGKYQIQGEIARGGVGVVLKGHDTELGRDVALKMIREEYADHPEVTHRFVEEAQIGAQLQHPGIVPVYDLGLQDGHPFFTMKLIKGRTLAALLEEGRERRQKLLAIFEAVCQTMAYTHSRGVIHRDLKPANIMVGAFGEVQVVDWGMGKVLGAGGVADERRSIKAQQTIVATLRSGTESVGSQSIVGSVMGTPSYMPPEQAMGDVENMDERSDVFSLGAILAEILTGQPPYPGKGLELIRRAAKGDLEECRGRIAACDADEELKNLALACLSPSREGRLRNAGEVSERIGGYLASIEERAHAAQVEAAEERVRVAEAKRKQKLTLALAASILLTVVAAGGGWWWYSSQAAAREAKARDQFQGVVLEAGRAVDPAAALAAAARARDLMAGAETTMPAGAVADLQRIEADARAAQDQQRIKEENRKLLARLDELRGPGVEDERFVVDWADTDRRFTEAFAQHGLKPDVGTVAEAAAALATRGEDGAFALALDDWTFIRREAKAAEGARRLADVASLLDGDPTRARLRTALLASDAPVLEKLAREADIPSLGPRTLYLLGESLYRLSDPRTIYTFHAAAHDAHPGDFYIAHGLARSMYKMARQVGEVTHGKALRYYLVARALQPRNYIINVELAQQYINAREHERAEQFLRTMIAARPEDPILSAELGLLLGRRGRYGEAEAQFEASIRLDAKQVWPRRQYADFLKRLGRVPEAIAQAEKAVALSRPDSVEAALAYFGLGLALQASGRHPDAIEAFRKSRELDSSDPGSLLSTAFSLNGLGRRDEALATARNALRDHADVPGIEVQVAFGLASFGAPEEALELARAGLVKAKASRHAGRMVRAHLAQVRAHTVLGDSAKADAAFERVIAADPTDVTQLFGHAARLHGGGRYEEALNAIDRVLALEPKHVPAIWMAGTLHFSAGRFERAIEFHERALEVEPAFALAHGAKAEALQRLGRLSEGLASARRAVEVDPKLVPARMTLATLLQLNGEHAAALKEIESLNMPMNPGLLVVSGKAKGALGRRKEAIADLRMGLQLAPGNADGHLYLAFVLVEAHRPEEALPVANRLREAWPKMGASHFMLGLVLTRLGRIDEAAASYERGFELDSDNLFARLNAAELPAGKGNYEESLRRLRTLAATHADSALALRVLSWSLTVYPLEKRSAKEALALARRAVELDREQEAGTLAGALFRAGEHAEAESEFARALTQTKDDQAGVAFLRAMNLYQLGTKDEANEAYAEAKRRFAKEGTYPHAECVMLRDEAAQLFGDK